MATKTLSADELALGRAVLLATDSLGMSAEGAFWLYDGRDDEWRYFLVTSLFSRLDPREIYLCLNEALMKKLSENEIQNFRLYIAEPNENLVECLRNQIETRPFVSEPKGMFVEIEGKRTKTFVYRLAAGMHQDEARRVQRRFRQSCKVLAAA